MPTYRVVFASPSKSDQFIEASSMYISAPCVLFRDEQGEAIGVFRLNMFPASR